MSEVGSARSGGRSASRALLPGEIRSATGGILRPFLKGQSGNPNGGTSDYHAVRRLCAEHSLEASRRLIALMREGDDPRVTYMAIMAIMERGIGKPRDHSDEDNALARMNLAALDPSEQRLLIDLLRRVMGMPAPA